MKPPRLGGMHKARLKGNGTISIISVDTHAAASLLLLLLMLLMLLMLLRLLLVLLFFVFFVVLVLTMGCC